MHDAERGVAARDGVRQDAHGAHVEDALERQLLALHLAPDAVDVFRASRDLGLDARGCEFGAEPVHEAPDVVLAVEAPLVQCPRDALVVLGLQVAEREVLELPLELPDAEPVRERREHLTCLEGEAAHLGLGQVTGAPQVVELAREAHEHETRVGHDGEQHLAQRLGLRRAEAAIGCPLRARMELADALQSRGDRRGLVAVCGGGLPGRERARGEHRPEHRAHDDRRFRVQALDDGSDAEAAFHGRGGGRSRGRERAQPLARLVDVRIARSGPGLGRLHRCTTCRPTAAGPRDRGAAPGRLPV